MGRVYIDQDLCTGDGLCEEIAPAVFMSNDDGLYYVKNSDDSSGRDKHGEPTLKGVEGLASYPDDLADAVEEAAENCPGACIFVEQEDGTFKAE